MLNIKLSSVCWIKTPVKQCWSHSQMLLEPSSGSKLWPPSWVDVLKKFGNLRIQNLIKIVSLSVWAIYWGHFWAWLLLLLLPNLSAKKKNKFGKKLSKWIAFRKKYRHRIDSVNSMYDHKLPKVSTFNTRIYLQYRYSFLGNSTDNALHAMALPQPPA